MKSAHTYRDAIAVMDRLAAHTEDAAFDCEETAVRRALTDLANLFDPVMDLHDVTTAVICRDREFKRSRRFTIAKLIVKILESSPLWTPAGILRLTGGPGCQQVTLEPIDWLD